MSKSDDALSEFLFDDWLAGEFRDTEGFTALVILVAISALEVMPLRSTFMHVIGDDLDWPGFTQLLRGAGVEWDGVVLFPVVDDDGGPLNDAEARVQLAAYEKLVIENRLTINEGHFFDKWGRRMKIEEAQAH